MYRSITDNNPLRFFQPNVTGITAGDLNGDGITDFIRHIDYSADERTASPDDFIEKSMIYNLDAEGQISNYLIHYGALLYPVGDINNDGKDDIAIVNETGITLHGLSQGDLNSSSVEVAFKDIEFGLEVDQLIPENDLDGDGIKDIFAGLGAYADNLDCFIVFGSNNTETIESKTCNLSDDLNQRTSKFMAGDVKGDSIPEPVILSVGNWPYNYRLDVLRISDEREITIDTTQSLGDLNLLPVDARVFIANIDGENKSDIIISSNRFQPAGLFQRFFPRAPVTYAMYSLGDEADSLFSPYQVFKNDFIIDQVYENEDGTYSSLLMNNELVIHCEQGNINRNVSQFSESCLSADSLGSEPDVVLFSSTYYPRIDRGVSLDLPPLKSSNLQKNVARIGIGFKPTRDTGIFAWTAGYPITPTPNKSAIGFDFTENRITNLESVSQIGPGLKEELGIITGIGPGVGINFFLTKNATLDLSFSFGLGTFTSLNDGIQDRFRSAQFNGVEPAGNHTAISVSKIDPDADVSVQQIMFRLGTNIWMGGGQKAIAASDTNFIEEIQIIDFADFEGLSELDRPFINANNIGDINNDGFLDILFTSNSTGLKSGGLLNKAWGFYGGESFSETPDFVLDFKEDTTITNFGYFGLGIAVDGVGDVNNDGVNDFAVAFPNYSYQSTTGVVYVYYGSETSGSEKSTSAFDSPYPDLILQPRILEGQTIGSSGAQIAGGDFNGDMIDDIAIVSDYSFGDPVPPAVQIFFGGEQMDGIPDHFLYLDKSSIGGDSNEMISVTSGSTIQFLPVEEGKNYQDLLYLPGAFSGYPDAAIFTGGTQSDSLPDIRLVGPNINEAFGFLERNKMATGDLNGDGFYDIFLVKQFDSNDAFISGRVYAYSPNSGIINSNEEVNNPLEYRLSQNYPNPFNPSTNIEFRLGDASSVNLKVFDILGREVATLISDQFYNEGSHSIQFNASKLASGLYLYRLEAGGFIQTRKMMLVK